MTALPTELAELVDQPARRNGGQRAPFRPSTKLDAAAVRRATTRPGWHATLTPPVVAARWDDVLVAAEQLRTAESRVRQLAGDEAAELREVEAAVRVGIESSKPAKLTRSDWAAERVTREVTVTVRGEQLTAARRAYDELVSIERASWVAGLDLDALRDKAAAALAPAVEAFDRWRAAVALVTEAERDRDPDRAAVLTRHTPPAVRDLIAAGRLDGAVALLASEHPTVTGAWVGEDTTVLPPVRVRREIFVHGDEAAVHELAGREADEDYRHTAFTREELGHLYGADKEEPGPEGRRWAFAS